MKLLFKRGPLLGLRTLTLVLFSLILIFLDHQVGYFQNVRATLSLVAVPLQYLVNWPIQLFSWIDQSITTQQRLIEENARMRAQQLLLQAKLQRVLALENENAQLRALLQSSTHAGGKYTVGQLLAVSMDPSVQRVVLDKGKRDNIYLGQPVLDAYGVMGQVIKVGLKTSEVLLVTDVQSAVPVQNSRNDVRAIAVGTGTGTLELINFPDSTDIKVGDVLVTSGLGERYPAGYPVGIVKSVGNDPEFRFAKVVITPSAHVDRSRQVLMIWPEIETTNPGATAIPQPEPTPNETVTDTSVPAAGSASSLGATP